jgi:hypothetical protein
METNNEKTEPVKINSTSGYIVKVYDTTEEILLNTMVEFIGIYYDHTVVKADSLPPA